MCIAILVPPKKMKYLTTEVLENCFEVNWDGIGYAYPEKDGTTTIKKFMYFHEFLEAWEDDKVRNEEVPIMLHFRATSVGTTDEDNCHPFVVHDGQVFCHNGTIHKVAKDTAKKASDTRMFNRLFLRELPYGWDNNTAIKGLIEEYIGQSKLIVLNADSSYNIFNEGKGEWVEGIWFSNGHHTGDYSRGAGVAYKSSTNVITYNNSSKYNDYYNRKNDKAKGKRGSFALTREEIEASRNKVNGKADEYPEGGSNEEMCEFCSKPFPVEDLILVTHGNNLNSFEVCATCANKIQ